MKTRTSFAVFVCLLLAAALPVAAHHSMAGYNSAKPITLTGTITRIEWTNPHVSVYIDAKDPVDGELKHWWAQLASTNCMVRHGINKETFTVGSTITMRDSWRAKDGSTNIVVFTLTYGTTTHRALILPSDPPEPPSASDARSPMGNECAP